MDRDRMNGSGLPRPRWTLIALVTMPLLSACSGIALSNSNDPMSLFGHGDICGLPAVSVASNFLMLLMAGVFAGFSHCVGMCGPLVTTFMLRRAPSNRAKSDTLTPMVMYQFGRLTTYTTLGAIMGVVSWVVRINIVGSGWQGTLSIFIGLLMLLTGLSLWGALPWLRWLESAQIARPISQWLRNFIQSNHPLAPFLMGLGNGLLPCGAVYAMAFVAATSGDPVRGAMIMFAFGLGTLPAMLGIGFIAKRLSLGLRGKLYRVASTLVMAVGVQLTLRGLALAGTVPHLSFGGAALW